MSNLYNWTNGRPLGIYVDIPVVADVRAGVRFDAYAKSGTLAVPAAGDVQAGVAVDAGIGTLVLPSAAQTLLGVGFGAAGTEFVGELALQSLDIACDLAVAAIAVEITDLNTINVEVADALTN